MIRAVIMGLAGDHALTQLEQRWDYIDAGYGRNGPRLFFRVCRIGRLQIYREAGHG